MYIYNLYKKDLPFLPNFFDRYIHLVGDEVSLIDGLRHTKDDLETVKSLLIKYQDFRYQEGKWTPKDILQHIIDTERIMCFRALAFARNDQNALTGFDENHYAEYTNAHHRTVDNLLNEFSVLRDSSIWLFSQFTREMLIREGFANGVNITPLALGFVLMGHVRHHKKILEEKYFLS